VSHLEQKAVTLKAFESPSQRKNYLFQTRSFSQPRSRSSCQFWRI